MTDYIFKTPTVDEGPAGKQFPFSRFKLTKGISIYKSGGVYAQTRYPSYDNIPNYDEFYLGGGTHTVTSAVRAALIAGGVGVTSDNFTAI
jgi:hypothetical protein